MKPLQLIDRVVVEVLAEQGSELSNRAIANQLRMIADEIEDDCMKGNNYQDEDLTQGTPEHGLNIEVLWERECPNYGGFKILSDKSLISQYYYKSEPKPLTISEATVEELHKWSCDYEEKDEDGAYKVPDNILLERASELIVQTIKEASA